MRRRAQLVRADFAGAVAACAQFVDAVRIDVETERRQHARERRRERQTDVTEADDGNARVVRRGQGRDIHRRLRGGKARV